MIIKMGVFRKFDHEDFVAGKSRLHMTLAVGGTLNPNQPIYQPLSDTRKHTVVYFNC